MRKLVLMIFFYALSTKAAPLCENVFHESPAEAQFTHYSQVLALESFKPREVRLALDLIARTGVGAEKFLYRYKDLSLLVTHEIAVVAPPEILFKLTAASLQKGFDVAKVRVYLGVILVQARSYSSLGEKTYRQQLPHRIHLALTELALLSEKSPGEVAFVYNENLKRIASEPPALDGFTLPIDTAVTATRQEILSESPK